MNVQGAVIAAVSMAVRAVLSAIIFPWCYPDVHYILEITAVTLGVQGQIGDLDIILQADTLGTKLLEDSVHLAGRILYTSINGAVTVGQALYACLNLLELRMVGMTNRHLSDETADLTKALIKEIFTTIGFSIHTIAAYFRSIVALCAIGFHGATTIIRLSEEHSYMLRCLRGFTAMALILLVVYQMYKAIKYLAHNLLPRVLNAV